MLDAMCSTSFTKSGHVEYLNTLCTALVEVFWPHVIVPQHNQHILNKSAHLDYGFAIEISQFRVP